MIPDGLWALWFNPGLNPDPVPRHLSLVSVPEASGTAVFPLRGGHGRVAALGPGCCWHGVRQVSPAPGTQGATAPALLHMCPVPPQPGAAVPEAVGWLWGGCGVCPTLPTSLAVLAGGAEGQGWSGASAELPGSASIIDGFLKGINQGLLHHSWPAVQGELGSAARGIQHPPERGPAQPLPKENLRSLLGSPQKRFFRVSGVTCTPWSGPGSGLGSHTLGGFTRGSRAPLGVIKV